MKIKIKRTGEIKELFCYNSDQDKEDPAWDMICSCGQAEGFEYNKEFDYYVTNNLNFIWWEDWFRRDKKAKLLLKDLLSRCSDKQKESVLACVEDACDCIYECRPASMLSAIKEMKSVRESAMKIKQKGKKMKIKLRDTSEIKELVCFNPGQGKEDCTWDMICNHDGEDKFEYDEESDCFVTDRPTFVWWKEWFREDRKAKLALERLLTLCSDADKDMVLARLEIESDYQFELVPCATLKSIERMQIEIKGKDKADNTPEGEEIVV